jgi:pyrroloquinoline quinone (PQQ) biosynthesis protein C
MENLCSRVSAYLYIGASVQMAYSLGLHRDQLAETETASEREQNHRIWWTLFTLDQELASRGGSPVIIDERFTKVNTPMSSEQVSNY